MPLMPGGRAPALWLSIAAIAISTVAVAAIAVSGGPRRPLTFAGSVLLPQAPQKAVPQAPPPATPPRTATRPTRAPSSATPTPTSVASTTGYAAPIVAVNGLPGARPTSHVVAAPSAASSATPAPDSSPAGPRTPSAAPSTVSLDRPALAQSLFASLNTARTQAGLAPLFWSYGLQRSAARHNELMAVANGLQARVGNEPALGVREADAGVAADYAAENLAMSETLNLTGALRSQQLMLAEIAPADSDRQNLLSAAVNAIGIDVLVDLAHGRLWITQDLARVS